jgi:hypothetical protein
MTALAISFSIAEKRGIDAAGVTLDGRFATGFQLKSKVENGTDPIVEYFRKGSAASHLSWRITTPTISPPRAICT